MFRRLLLAISLMGICLLAVPQTANAFNLFGGVDCGKAANSAVCNDNTGSNNPISGSKGILLKITDIIAYVAGAAAIIVIIISALQFVTSGSDTSTNSRTDADIENAKRAIANALIGLALIVLARTLIAFLVKKL